MKYWRVLICLGCLVLLWPLDQWAAASENESKFLRFLETGPQEGHVDTAITTYRLANGVEVALIAALHIGDKEYYEQLNHRFQKYDAVLYEMIKPNKLPSRRPGESTHPVSQMQRMMQSVLGLEFQLDGIDYAAANLVHADMDSKTFADQQRQKGENFFTLFLQSFLQERQMMLSGNGRPLSALDLLLAFSSEDRTHSFKWLFAQQLDQMEMMMAGMDQGIDGQGSVIVTERNRVAREVLDQQIRARRRRLAIFYGAGHMPDFETKLLARGFRKVRHEWIVAWELQK